ncbi:MAG: DNA mismatch repair protein MutS [Bacteriovoracales bacterium]|nr:DNA mismatch repair protein MutS [Bacteriovoracales bacterium]
MGEDNIPKASEVFESAPKATPMMAQYWEIKRKFPLDLVLFRMGDFYELFFEDAHKASEVLNIALTHRGKLGDVKIPMAGIPHHAASSYLDRLTRAGLKAAICEQVEDAASAKGIVKRAVSQIISPGLPYDVDKSDRWDHHYMACAVEEGGTFFLTCLDYTTGDFLGLVAHDEDALVEKLGLYAPKELICYLGQWDGFPRIKQFLTERSLLVTHLSRDHFDEKVNRFSLEKLIRGHHRDEVIGSHPSLLPALAALSFYICSTQRQENYHHIRPFRMEQEEGKLKISLSTLKGIEILPRSKETLKESLLGFFNRTKTAVGLRELKRLFQHPLGDPERIAKRLDTVEFFLGREELLKKTRSELSGIRDLERILVKLTRGKLLSGDLLNTAKAIRIFEGLKLSLVGIPEEEFLEVDLGEMDSLLDLARNIEKTINDDLSAHREKGNLICTGLNPERDRLKGLADNAGAALKELEKTYRRECDVGTLRIKHNNVLGHFIEMSKGQASKAPNTFVRKQTLVNCERFSSDELQKLEEEILEAKDKLIKLEKEILAGLLNKMALLSPAILALSRTLGRLDALSTFSWLALKEDLVRPLIHPDRQILRIQKGWHPLIKANREDIFVPHDIDLNEECFFGLITGPNMAGKTTVMREVAIIQFLAQMGSFVPAEAAELGLCDYIFSRLGASDDIVNGQSTFMVEMSETSTILRHATPKSLILFDEVGRGTSTYDGMSIAWALVEFLVKKTKALCLFSTHYHELIEVVEGLPRAANFTVETVTSKGEVKFLYRLIRGAALESFGLYVAKLAGLPGVVLKRSGEILGQWEGDQKGGPQKESVGVPSKDLESQLELPLHSSRLEEDMAALNIMEMTPLEALQKLAEFQKECRDR